MIVARPAAPLGLTFPFEQKHQEHDSSAPHFATISFGHIRKRLAQMQYIHLREMITSANGVATVTPSPSVASRAYRIRVESRRRGDIGRVQ